LTVAIPVAVENADMNGRGDEASAQSRQTLFRGEKAYSLKVLSQPLTLYVIVGVGMVAAAAP